MKNFQKENAKVLIVEDNPESIDLLHYFLKPFGYTLDTVTDGEQALEYIKTQLPDIILLDVMLPKLDGFEVCRHLKGDERTFHIPIIMITALKELRDKIKALEAGVDDFISKPFESVELTTRVNSLLRIKFYHDEIIKRNRELENQKRTLEREDKLKKELTNLIVHDMKSPLFVIQGNLQMMNMIKDSGSNNHDEKYTKRIERSSRGLLRMILNLLDISRLEQETIEFEPVPVDISKIVLEAATYFQDIPEHSKKSIDIQISEEIQSVFVDKPIFERIINNLFSFAFQNAGDNSTIRVKTETFGEDFIILKISHEGRHIPEKFHKKIFTKFAQNELKNAGFKPARGLGLIFCRMAIEANGGTIEIDPEFKDGTAFILRLPVWRSQVSEQSQPSEVDTLD
ncbi:MAG: response regulator [Nitrosopumilaceae archaeon]|nr:response regulator [Nitrosopumilaceae archaeon]NIV65505.1 response regulator [Nitrosopumilaceae archaeon]NIX61065.1 response regulator [Nitrosopumilaceae archaeon]